MLWDGCVLGDVWLHQKKKPEASRFIKKFQALLCVNLVDCSCFFGNLLKWIEILLKFVTIVKNLIDRATHSPLDKE